MTTINMEGLRELTDEELELVAGGHTRSIDPNPPIGPIYPIPPLNPDGHFGLVRLTTLGPDMPWTKA